MKKTVIICCLVLVTTPTGTVCCGQTKFLAWFRQRIGERNAPDANQAKDNSNLQKNRFVNAAAQKKLAAAVKKARCSPCHVKGKGKKFRYAFGKKLSQLLQTDLKMDSKPISAALKFSAPTEIRHRAVRQKVAVWIG